MNNKIRETLDLLNAAVAEAEATVNDSFTLKWTASKQELEVLLAVCRADISVPAVVQKFDPGVVASRSRSVLQSLGAEIDRLLR